MSELPPARPDQLPSLMQRDQRRERLLRDAEMVLARSPSLPYSPAQRSIRARIRAELDLPADARVEQT